MESLSGLGHVLWTIIAGLLMLTVLVFVHELGHYLLARAMGMHVNAFAIMMGGVRKTDLTPFLAKRLAQKWIVGASFLAGIVLSVVGDSSGGRWLYLAGLSISGFFVPVWVMSRLSALYHLSPSKVPLTLVKCVGVGLLVLAFGTKMQGITPEMLVGVTVGATVIALILVYYVPIHQKEQEDDRQGFGQILVSRSLAGGQEAVPVRFRPIWSRTANDGTEFSLLLLPLGGFAAIKGMHPKPDGSEVSIENGFYSKPPWKRLVALFAGPAFSILFGFILLFWQYGTIGKQSPVNEPVIGGMIVGGAADRAGLMVGDRITSIDGVKVSTFYEMILNVKDKWEVGADNKKTGKPITVGFERGGTHGVVTVIPQYDVEPRVALGPDLEPLDEKRSQARIEAGPRTDYKKLTASAALKEALLEPVKMAVGVASIFLKPAEAKENLSGPTVMAQATSAAVQEGSATFLWLSAMLSISLGIMNLLPIVPLDGGQMMVATVELFRGGRRLSINVQNLLANCGFALLALLMLVATAADLGRSAKQNQDDEKKPPSLESQSAPE